MRQDRIRATPVTARLARALVGSGEAAGVRVAVDKHRSRPWASATYVGERHRVTLGAPRSPTLGGWVAALPDAELAMRDHIVASLAVDRIEDDGDHVTLILDVLTIEES